MKEAGIDVLVAPPNTGRQRAQPGRCPLPDPVWYERRTDRLRVPFEWKRHRLRRTEHELVSRWIEDTRSPRRTYNEAIVDALKEQGVEHGTIGVCGLQPGKSEF